MNETIDIWSLEDKESIFDFQKIEKYFADYSIEEIINAFIDESIQELGVLSIERTEAGDFFVIESEKIAFSLYESWERYDLTDRKTLEYITFPVFKDSNGDIDLVVENDYLWKMRWEESNSIDTVAVGTTNFYEKYGWWPFMVSHIDSNITTHLLPAAEIIVEGKHGYVFFEVDYINNETKFLEKYFPWDSDDSRSIVIFDTEEELKAGFVKGQLSDGIANLFKDGEDEDNSCRTRLIPFDPLFRFSAGCQDDYIPDPPYNNFLYQLPVTWYGVDRDEDGYFTIDSGDISSFSLYWDKNWNFVLHYQQT